MDPLWWSEALKRDPRVDGHAASRHRFQLFRFFRGELRVDKSALLLATAMDLFRGK